MYVHSSKPSRSGRPCRSPRLAVRIATIMVTISGIDASRLSKPTSRSDPQASSALDASKALKPGAGIPSSVKKPVTLSRSCSLPQPVPMKTTPSVSRARVGPIHDRRPAVERNAASARERRSMVCSVFEGEETSSGQGARYSRVTAGQIERT